MRTGTMRGRKSGAFTDAGVEIVANAYTDAAVEMVTGAFTDAVVEMDAGAFTDAAVERIRWSKGKETNEEGK